ncbi:MAG: hypothetical protein GXY36_04900 [Chloroflexi bacterium]|nr:hypothetical protein [Chloroflexota bacterium]
MPIELTWLVPEKILLSRWIGEISPDDMRVAVEELLIILDSASELIHSVIDLGDFHKTHADAIRVYVESPVRAHPNRGQIGVIDAPGDLQSLLDQINRAWQRRMLRYFDSRAEARDFLLAHDHPPPLDPAHCSRAER